MGKQMRPSHHAAGNRGVLPITTRTCHMPLLSLGGWGAQEPGISLTNPFRFLNFFYNYLNLIKEEQPLTFIHFQNELKLLREAEFMTYWGKKTQNISFFFSPFVE